MPYSEKYYHSYCDSFGIPCKVSVLKKDYEGSATEMEAQDPPFLKTYESNSDFKFDPIRSTSGECNFVFGTDNGVDFEELWTADEKEFKVIHYVDSIVDWAGFVIPDGFSYDLRGGLYYGTLKAADGLKTLESIPFSFGYDEPYGTQDLTYNNGFEFPFILILTEILRKLNLDLNTWTCVDVYEKSMTKTGDARNADPLATSFANVKTYINDTERKDIPYWKDVNEVMNCREVLENMCILFGARVTQNKGVWRFKRINSDANYGSGITQRYWRKYNTLAVYLGLETINDEDLIPCSSVSKAMIGTDHIVRMDEVYSAYRMNYKFQLIREGDTPLNLVTNGDFAAFNNTSILAAPDSWFRWREGNKWPPRLKPITIPASDAGGFTTGIEMGTQTPGIGTTNTDPVGQVWAALRFATNVSVTKSDELILTAFMRYGNPAGAIKNDFAPFIRVTIDGSSGTKYWLRNNTDGGLAGDISFLWDKGDGQTKAKDDIFTLLHNVYATPVNGVDHKYYNWKNFNLKLPAIPENGTLTFDINGLAGVSGKSTDSFPKIKTFFNRGRDQFRYWFPIREGEFVDGSGSVDRLQITGISLGKMPSPNEYAQEQDYIYRNENPNYSLEVDPVEVLNGDVLDQQHTSRIIVPSNVSNEKNFWDTIDNKYGYSSLGLVTVKSVMNLYFKQFRLMDGDVKSRFGNIDTRFTFEAIPGKTFGILRCTFNQKRNYIESATFFELSDAVIGSGGTEGNNSVEANYIVTGKIRCIKSGGLNTGQIEREYIDINVNSETYNQNTWLIVAAPDTVTCPIGEPTRYYWGTDDASYEISNFTSDGFYIDPDNSYEITASFNNTGGNYIYFVHLASLGVVESISNESQNEIISDFQYLSDTVIGSYTYRVLRQNYITSSFQDLQITFTFS